MIQPVERRIASSTSRISATPKNTSQSFGVIERSKKSSPCEIRYAHTATPSSASTQSHGITRCRKRRATGKMRNVRNRTNATCVARITSVRTISYEA